MRGGIGVAGGGVESEGGPALAAVHLDLEHFHLSAQTVPAPLDVDVCVGLQWPLSNYRPLSR